MKVMFGNGATDPERAVLPTIMYICMKDELHQVRGISIGWWKWGIIITTKPKELPTNE